MRRGKRNGEIIGLLREKNENEAQLRKEELKLQMERIELENRKLEQEAESINRMFEMMAALIAQKNSAKMKRMNEQYGKLKEGLN